MSNNSTKAGMNYGPRFYGCAPFCYECARMAFEELSHTRNKAFYRFKIRKRGMRSQDMQRLERRFKGTNMSWSTNS